MYEAFRRLKFAALHLQHHRQSTTAAARGKRAVTLSHGRDSQGTPDAVPSVCASSWSVLVGPRHNDFRDDQLTSGSIVGSLTVSQSHRMPEHTPELEGQP